MTSLSSGLGTAARSASLSSCALGHHGGGGSKGSWVTPHTWLGAEPGGGTCGSGARACPGPRGTGTPCERPPARSLLLSLQGRSWEAKEDSAGVRDREGRRQTRVRPGVTPGTGAGEGGCPREGTSQAGPGRGSAPRDAPSVPWPAASLTPNQVLLPRTGAPPGGRTPGPTLKRTKIHGAKITEVGQQ